MAHSAIKHILGWGNVQHVRQVHLAMIRLVHARTGRVLLYDSPRSLQLVLIHEVHLVQQHHVGTLELSNSHCTGPHSIGGVLGHCVSVHHRHHRVQPRVILPNFSCTAATSCVGSVVPLVSITR